MTWWRLEECKSAADVLALFSRYAVGPSDTLKSLYTNIHPPHAVVAVAIVVCGHPKRTKLRIQQAVSILPDESLGIDDVRVSPRLSLHAIHEMPSAPQSIAVCAIPDRDELYGAVGACKIQQEIIAIGVGGVILR